MWPLALMPRVCYSQLNLVGGTCVAWQSPQVVLQLRCYVTNDILSNEITLFQPFIWHICWKRLLLASAEQEQGQPSLPGHVAPTGATWLRYPSLL